MINEKYLQSIEARLKLQDQLIRHLFRLLYEDNQTDFVQFLESQESGLVQHQGAADELKLAIKMHLDSWGNQTISEMHAAQALRKAQATGPDSSS